MSHRYSLFRHFIAVFLFGALFMLLAHQNVYAVGSSDQERSSEGTAYAVQTADGDLIFFRSYETYEDSFDEQNVTDILGNTYTGRIFTGIEDNCWFAHEHEIYRVYAADGQAFKVGNTFGFYNCRRLKSIKTAGIDTSNCENFTFEECVALETADLSNLNTSKATDMSRMFHYDTSLKTLDLSSFDTSNVTTMQEMFWYCKSLESVNFGSIDTKNVGDMSSMFSGCESLKSVDFSRLDSSSIYSLSNMFRDCSSLTEVDLSNFDCFAHTSYMFSGCSNLRTVNIANLNKGDDCDEESCRLYSINNTFDGCDNLNSVTLGKDAYFDYLPSGLWKNGQSVVTGRSITTEGGTWTKIQEGTGYAVLDDEGKMTFFRSREEYTGTEKQTVTDIEGNTYYGRIYTGFEDFNADSWFGERDSILAVDIADGQRILFGEYSSWDFYDSTNVKSIDLRGVITAGVTDFRYMFSGCASLKTLDISDLDVSSAEYMKDMFAGCNSLETVVLGPKFTKWLDKAYLPVGTWQNGSLQKKEIELYEQYPSNASKWAGTWKRISGMGKGEATRIFFPDSVYTISVAQTLVLTPYVEPMETTSTIKFTSSNDRIVDCDLYDGVYYLFGLKVGTATITAAADNGVKATCRVRVVFTDVPATGKYYSDPVYWAVDKGITNGYTDPVNGLAKEFRPQNNCTREAVVTFLWRLAGKPNPKSMKSPFKDVQDSSKYYYKAVLWAAEKGITGGYSDGTFKPSATCLREHVVTFLWRYAGKPDPKVSKNPFNDVRSSDYFYKAALWANAKGIAKGYTTGEYAGGFGPKLDCLREHVVTFLYRYAK